MYDGIYRVQVWYDKHWVWGLNDYNTEEAAQERVKKMKSVGIRARVRPLAELLAR